MSAIGKFIPKSGAECRIEQKQAQLQKRNERDLYQEEVEQIEQSLAELKKQLAQADDMAALFSEAVKNDH